MSGLTDSFLLSSVTQVALASCKASVAIAVLLLCRRWLAAFLPASFRHVLWMGVVASLLLPGRFDVPIGWRGAPLSAAQEESATVAVADGGHVPELAPQVIDDRAPDVPGIAQPFEAGSPAAALPAGQATAAAGSWRAWLAWLWIIGVLAVSAVPLWNLLRYRLVVARAAPLRGRTLELLEQCRERAGLRRPIRLLESAEVPAPAVLGWLFPVLLLPPGMAARLNAPQLRHVFLHELAHVRRHDILTNWLSTLAQALHWFNPFVWLALRAMRTDMEQACDARVLHWLPADERSGYGHTLIDLLDGVPARVPAHGLGIVEEPAQLRERIALIALFGSRRATSPALVVLLVAAVTSVAAVQPRFDVPDGAPVEDALPAQETAVAAEPSGPGSFPGARDAMPATVAGTSRESVAAAGPAAAVSTAPALMAAQDSQPAAISGVAGAPAPPAFTVRLRTPGDAPVPADIANNEFPDNYIFALASRLRAVPGLTLVEPGSTVASEQSVDYEIAITFQPGQYWWAYMTVRSFGDEGARRAERLARMYEEGRRPLGYRFQPGDTVEDLERNLDEIRMSVFPPNAALHQQLDSRLQDTKVPFSRRLHALELLLEFGVPPGSTADPVVVRRGAVFAATLTDAREKLAVWSLLSETRSAEFSALFPGLLAEALAGDDSESRLLMMQVWGGEHAHVPQVRSALQDIAGSDPVLETRVFAQQLLAASGD